MGRHAVREDDLDVLLRGRVLVDLYSVLGDLEDRLIREALERSGGNRNQAALALGIKRTTLVEKLRKMSQRGEG